MGDDSNSLCQIMDETSKGPGDRIRTILRMQLTGAGQTGDNTLEGNEEALITFTDNLLIDQLRHAVRSGGNMSDQRVPFEVREEARMGLQDWWAAKFDEWFFNQLSGNTAVTDTSRTGLNAALTPTAAVYAGSATAESNLSANASQTFSLEVIDRAVLKARTLTPVMRPLSGTQEPGKAQFVVFVTPEMTYDLRTNSSNLQWADIQKYSLAGGGAADNPLFKGALGMYNGCVLHESFRLPRITTATGANQGGRAILCGAQAAVMAFGRGYSKNRMEWVEELFDYKNQLGVSAGVIAGLKKLQYNSADLSVVTISAQHSASAISGAGR